MKWSKLKQMIEESFSDSIRKRVQVHLTSYRGIDGNSRSWIVIDGEEKISLDNFTSIIKNGAYFNELTPIKDCLTHSEIKKNKRSENKLYEKGEFSSFDFTFMAKQYLQKSAHDSIKSNHPILRTLGVLNKKIGKAKVKELQYDENPIVAYFAKFRYEAETGKTSNKNEETNNLS